MNEIPKNKALYAAVLAVALLPPCVNAEGTATMAPASSGMTDNAADLSSDDSVSKDITYYKNRTFLLKAQKEYQEAVNAVAVKEMEGRQYGAGLSDPSDSQIPLVKSISDFGNGISAELVFSNGSYLEVQRGDKLPNGWVVDNITQKSVSVRSGRHVRILANMSSKTTGSTTGYSAGVPSFVPPPPPSYAPTPPIPSQQTVAVPPSTN